MSVNNNSNNNTLRCRRRRRETSAAGCCAPGTQPSITAATCPVIITRWKATAAVPFVVPTGGIFDGGGDGSVADSSGGGCRRARSAHSLLVLSPR